MRTARLRGAIAALTLALVGALAAPALADTGAESTGADQYADQGTLGDTSGVVTPTSAEIAASQITWCTGYGADLSSISSSGHTLSTKANVCGVYYGSVWINGVLHYRWGAVIRWYCYRDQVQFGSGTGGCRWKGSESIYRDQVGDNHNWTHMYAEPGSSSTAFWQDSGRIYTGYRNFPSGSSIQLCEDDWGYDVGGYALGNGAVHFMGTTGVDYGTYNTADKCTTYHSVNDTP
jgi:hypothetical protein